MKITYNHGGPNKTTYCPLNKVANVIVTLRHLGYSIIAVTK
jgi:hypothetical protein